MTQRGFQKIADSHSRQTVLFSTGFESKDILFVNLDFRRVLNQYNALMVGNEFHQKISESRFATRCSPTNENVFALRNVLFQLSSECGSKCSHFNEVFHPESMGVELSNRQSDTVDTARWNHGCNAASIGQT